MLYQDPRLTFKSLALRQWKELSLNRQNLVTQVLRELMEKQDHNEDHASNDNPLMRGCSLFEAHSKCLTKWGIKITYGVCQDKIDIVCIEVDPSPLPPSGPQAISIRSFSANDNYEFVQHPIVEVRVAFTDFKKVGAWLGAAKKNYTRKLTHRFAVENSFTLNMSANMANISYHAALPCKEKSRIETQLKLCFGDVERCASTILLAAHHLESINCVIPAGAVTMSSMLIGLTMRVYDENMWKSGAISGVRDLCKSKDQVQIFATSYLDSASMGLSDFDRVTVPNNLGASIFLDQLRPSYDLLEWGDWCNSDIGPSAFPLLGAIIVPAGQPHFS